jgi:hypothetical protein
MIPRVIFIRSGRGVVTACRGGRRRFGGGFLGGRAATVVLGLSVLVAAGVATFGSPAADDSLAEARVWQTQSFPLRTGWSAIYAQVDAGGASLDQLAGENPDLEEVWRWTPEHASLQFLDSPDRPADASGNWLMWKRGSGSANTLSRFAANAAYLVKLRAGATRFQWNVQGSPVPVFYNWKSDGMNLVGFSTRPQAPPNFADFFAPVPRFLSLEIPVYQYRGGDLGPANPLQILTLRNTLVRRGEAFWVRADNSARYYGPFEVQLSDRRGLVFGDRLSRYEVTLRNVSSKELRVTARILASEPAPAGAEPLATKNGSTPHPPALLIRGDLNPATFHHDYQVLAADTPRSWPLKERGEEGSEITLCLGMDWAGLAGAPGALNGGILRFADEDSGQAQYDLPLTARVPDVGGLWVGEAAITEVQEDLKSFRKSSDRGNVRASSAGDWALTWLKRAPEGGTPSDATDASKWQVVDGLYYRKVVKAYSGLTVGAVMPPPERDEQGRVLADPDTYWQARPLDPSFAFGCHYDPVRQAVVANAYQHVVSLVWKKAAGVTNPPSGTFPDTQSMTYEGALEGQALLPPDRAELSVAASFWNARPFGAPDAPLFGYDAASQTVTSRVDGTLTVTWLKATAEATMPEDAADAAKWVDADGQYYRKLDRDYVGITRGTLLAPPPTNEVGADLEVPAGYWQSRPFHPAYAAGYAFEAATAKPVANGLRDRLTLLWLRADDPQPSLGTSRTYTNFVEGAVLLPPALARVPVTAAHWEPHPTNAVPAKPSFEFAAASESRATTPDGRYIQTSGSQAWTSVPKAMPLRLILHAEPRSGGDHAVRLLQRVYFALDSTGRVVLATQPSALTVSNSSIRRLSSLHVPWTERNHPIPCAGGLRGSLSGEMVSGYSDPISNPFVHTYHPDHDNRDARFESVLGRGRESYSIRRAFTLLAVAVSEDFESRARGGDTLPAIYQERVRLEGGDGFAKEYQIRGGCLLRRIATTPTLLVP